MPYLFLKYPGYKKDFVYGSVNMQSDEGILKDSLSGKHGKQKEWSAESIATVVEHIKSFPKVDSHYCRKECKANDQFGAVCFDMQQLLPCPKSNSSTFYYERKLYVHNLTMYDLVTAEVRCFMWPEFKARRGASEVATCLAKFIEEKSNGGCKDLTLFYDNCQDKTATVLWHSC